MRSGQRFGFGRGHIGRRRWNLLRDVAGSLFIMHERVPLGGTRGVIRSHRVVLLVRLKFGILLERFPILLVGGCIPRLGLGARLYGSQFVACQLRAAPDRPERLALGALDLRWVCAAAAFEVQMLSDRVVE
jgi:hypothetical protein